MLMGSDIDGQSKTKAALINPDLAGTEIAGEMTGHSMPF
jgi:hypothetical protein